MMQEILIVCCLVIASQALPMTDTNADNTGSVVEPDFDVKEAIERYGQIQFTIGQLSKQAEEIESMLLQTAADQLSDNTSDASQSSSNMEARQHWSIGLLPGGK
jgi:hypothetical protein